MTRRPDDIRPALAAMAAQVREHRDLARQEAAVAIRIDGGAWFCAGKGAPVVRCATLAAWDEATR